jgi:hypothetical protein
MLFGSCAMLMFKCGMVFVCFVTVVLFTLQVRYATERIRNAASQMFGKEGKKTHLSKKVVNFKAMPIVPVINIIIEMCTINFLFFASLSYL